MSAKKAQAAAVEEAPPKELKKGRRAVQDLALQIEGVEQHRTNPLQFDIPEALATLDEWFVQWRDIPDLCLDARTLNGVSRVLQLQETRLRYEASLYHADPGYIIDKLRKLPENALADIFLAAFHPLVELEQMVPETFAEAQQYYDALEPWESRRRERVVERAPEPQSLKLEDLYATGLLERQGFEGGLMRLMDELRERGAGDYHRFIAGPDYKTTVHRAYGVSFLVTYGHADLFPKDGALVLAPKGHKEAVEGGQSMPIALIPA